MQTDWLERLQCQQCSKCFSREDHLRRHELTHNFPKFACEYQGCGMRFHRQDVLKRHQNVHTGDSWKPRRKPRRGSLPLTFASVVADTSTPQPRSQSISSPEMEDVEYNVDQSDMPLEWPSDLIDWMSPSFVFDLNGPIQPTTSGGLPFEGYDYGEQSIPTALKNSSSYSANHLDPDRLESTMAACMASFQRHYLPRLPFIHESSIREHDLPDEIKYSMAALGSLHLDQHKDIANELHDRSIQEIGGKTTIPGLRQIQSQVLMIEYAIWSRDEEKRQWAIKEQQAVAMLRDMPGQIDKFHWTAWRAAEELKRTVFAFYVISALASAFLSHSSPICCQDIKLSLPCSEMLWNATSESDWISLSQSASSLGDANADFQEAVHALIVQDNMVDCGHESACTFTQYILLCSILETITQAKKLAVNYSSLDGYRHSRMEVFLLRESMTKVLGICKSLWWASPECLWKTTARAHPRTENILLLQYMLIIVNGPGDSQSAPHGQALIAVEAAAEVFCSCSKIGFLEVARTCRATISRPGRHCAVASARILKAWAKGVDPTSRGKNLSHHENSILLQVCQGIRRGFNEGLKMTAEANNNSPLEQFETAITNMWCTMLGTRDWI